MKRFNSPHDITDEDIREQFENATEVKFSARRFNKIQYRMISFGDLGWWLPLTRVLPIIGVTPEMLLPVCGYSAEEKLTRREMPSTPLRLRLERLGYPERDDASMYHVTRYKQLGSFPLAKVLFEDLSSILGKSVKVLREDGGSGQHFHLFTVQPSESRLAAV